MKHFFIIIILVSLAACQSKEQQKQTAKLDPIECSILKQFCMDLSASINRYEYIKFRRAWSDSTFKSRIVGLSKIEKMLLREYYEDVFASEILNEHIETITTLKAHNGSIKFEKIKYYPKHAEAIFTHTFLNSVGFWKLKIDLVNERPYITDLYSYTEKKWLSKSVKDFLKLNSKYTSISKERRNANISQLEASKHIRNGDTASALEELYQVPLEYQLGNKLSVQRIRMASMLSESQLLESLQIEEEINPSFYVKYVCAYHFGDTAGLHNSIRQLDKELDIPNTLVDSLYSGAYYWQ